MQQWFPRVGSRAAFGALAAALIVGCAEQPRTVTVGDAVEATATVESVDYANRIVTLKDADGRPLVVVAGPEVRNLAQVKPGDRVVARYQVAVAAEIKKPGTGVAGIQVESPTATRAQPGERPAASVSQSVRTTVQVVEVDPVANMVDVKGPRGYYRRIKVVDPRAREFIRHLKPGDDVELTFTEAVALSVEPVK